MPTPTKIVNPDLFQIRSLLYSKFTNQSIRSKKEALIIELLDISETTWNRIITAQAGSDKPQILDVYAAHTIASELGVEIKDLLNPELI